MIICFILSTGGAVLMALGALFQIEVVNLWLKPTYVTVTVCAGLFGILLTAMLPTQD